MTINKISMSHLFHLPIELHIEILVWLVVRHFDTGLSLISEIDRLAAHFDKVFVGLAPPEEEEEEEAPRERYKISDIALVLATNADVGLEQYLTACSTARLCWRSHRRTIFRRAAAECLKGLEPRVKAIRRVMMRAWFQRAVWRVVNPEYHGWEIIENHDNIRAQEAWCDFYESTLEFWDLDHKASALRMILSDEEGFLDRFFGHSDKDKADPRINAWISEARAMPREKTVRSSAKRASLSPANC
jgi:hypothetical protein